MLFRFKFMTFVFTLSLFTLIIHIVAEDNPAAEENPATEDNPATEGNPATEDNPTGVDEKETPSIIPDTNNTATVPESSEYCHKSTEQISPTDIIFLKSNVTQEPLEESNDAWKSWFVNRYYGVKRDLFYMKNNEMKPATIQLGLEPTSDATLMGTHEGWKEEYVLAKIELYWSLKDDFGSCHSVNQVTYPFEIQVIHYKKSAGSLSAAATQPNGILILCSLYELVEDDNHAIEPIANIAEFLSKDDSFKMHHVHGPVDPKTLYPYDLSNVQYSGPYPFEPCAREAKYVVFTNTRTISNGQIAKFRKLKNPEGQPHPGVYALYTPGKDSKSVEIYNNFRMNITHLEDFSSGRISVKHFTINYYHTFLIMLLFVLLEI